MQQHHDSVGSATKGIQRLHRAALPQQQPTGPRAYQPVDPAYSSSLAAHGGFTDEQYAYLLGAQAAGLLDVQQPSVTSTAPSCLEQVSTAQHPDGALLYNPFTPELHSWDIRSDGQPGQRLFAQTGEEHRELLQSHMDRQKKFAYRYGLAAL